MILSQKWNAVLFQASINFVFITIFNEREENKRVKFILTKKTLQRVKTI